MVNYVLCSKERIPPTTITSTFLSCFQAYYRAPVPLYCWFLSIVQPETGVGLVRSVRFCLITLEINHDERKDFLVLTKKYDISVIITIITNTRDQTRIHSNLFLQRGSQIKEINDDFPEMR